MASNVMECDVVKCIRSAMGGTIRRRCIPLHFCDRLFHSPGRA